VRGSVSRGGRSACVDENDLFALSDRCRQEKHSQFAMNSAIFCRT